MNTKNDVLLEIGTVVQLQLDPRDCNIISWVRDVYPMCRITERSVLWYNPVKSEHYYIYKGIALFDVFHKKTADVKELHIPYYYHTAPCYRCVRKGEVIRFRCEDIVRVYEVSPN
jgi:hypothetical protein